jgi:hypothetical protein
LVSPGTEETGWFGSAAGGGVGITVGIVALGSEFVLAATAKGAERRTARRMGVFIGG